MVLLLDRMGCSPWLVRAAEVSGYWLRISLLMGKPWGR